MSKIFILIFLILASGNVSSEDSSEFYAEQQFIISKDQSRLDNAYPIDNYVYPMLYFGRVDQSTGKFDMPPIKSFQNQNTISWFESVRVTIENGVFTRPSYIRKWYRDTNKQDPFEVKELVDKQISYMEEEADHLRNSKSILIQMRNKLKPYNASKGGFELQTAENRYYCNGQGNNYEQPTYTYNEKDNRIFTQDYFKLNKRNPELGHEYLLCVDFYNLTVNKFPFKVLPTSEELARRIHKENQIQLISILGECELSNFKYKNSPNLKLWKRGYYNKFYNDFASCPITKIHLMGYDEVNYGYVNLASYKVSDRLLSEYKSNKHNVEKIKMVKEATEFNNNGSPQKPKKEIKQRIKLN